MFCVEGPGYALVWTGGACRDGPAPAWYCSCRVLLLVCGPAKIPRAGSFFSICKIRLLTELRENFGHGSLISLSYPEQHIKMEFLGPSHIICPCTKCSRLTSYLYASVSGRKVTSAFSITPTYLAMWVTKEVMSMGVRLGTTGLLTSVEYSRVGSSIWICPTSFVSTQIGVELVDSLGN